MDSSLAYQGCGREIGMDEVYEINQFAIENHMPDKTIFLQIDAETGLKRIRRGREVLDRLDQESIDSTSVFMRLSKRLSISTLIV